MLKLPPSHFPPTFKKMFSRRSTEEKVFPHHCNETQSLAWSCTVFCVGVLLQRCRPVMPTAERSRGLLGPAACQSGDLSPAVAPQAASVETKQESAGVSWCLASLMLAPLIAEGNRLHSHNSLLVWAGNKYWLKHTNHTSLLAKSLHSGCMEARLSCCKENNLQHYGRNIIIIVIIFLLSEQLCCPLCEIWVHVWVNATNHFGIHGSWISNNLLDSCWASPGRIVQNSLVTNPSITDLSLLLLMS